ncbi:hypothetical protein [Streptomyces sp. NPDC047014]|uniref:hypothetical protein n=1 Tax=Streptomyces sp. NPDC047014 TaxID=3155736 RepID=UPI0033E07E55
MDIPVTVHHARLGPRAYQVVRPARPLEHAALLDTGHYLNAYLDQAAARTVAALWHLAAASPRTLVHLPLRPPGTGSPEAGGPRPLDLVLLHHTLQFAPAHWKELRRRLGPGTRRTMSPPARAAAEPDRTTVHHAGRRDVLVEHTHAETLFLTGSAKAFRRTAGVFHEIADNGPAHWRDPARRGHCCARLDPGGPHARELHVEYAESAEFGEADPAA